jgi:hypothetical protein
MCTLARVIATFFLFSLFLGSVLMTSATSCRATTDDRALSGPFCAVEHIAARSKTSAGGRRCRDLRRGPSHDHTLVRANAASAFRTLRTVSKTLPDHAAKLYLILCRADLLTLT